MNAFFLIATALTVSADAFFCGFSLSLGGEKKAPVLAGISMTVLCLCLAAGLLGSALSDVFTEEVSLLGGLILAAVGVYNLTGETNPQKKRRGAMKQSVLVGVAVGLDGAVATLSLTMMGYPSLVVPLVVTAMHFLTILLGILLSESAAFSKMKRARAVAPIMLIALGVYKMLSAFL